MTEPDHPASDRPRTGDLRFPDLARAGKPDWWRYLIGAVVIVGGGTAIGTAAWAMLPEALDLWYDGVRDWTRVELGLAALAFAVLMGTVALLLPLTLAVVPRLHGRPARGFLTGRRRFSWRLFAISLGAMLAIGTAVNVASHVLFQGGVALAYEPSAFWWFVPLVLVMVPLQSAAEEVVFRGYLTQAVGHATGRFWVRLVVPAVLFVMVHPSGESIAEGALWNYATFCFFALYLGWLALETNGLEAAIGLHAGSNLLVSSVVGTATAPMIAPPVLFAPNPDPGVNFATVIVVLGLHWLVVRRAARA